ncbi:MAG: hypothetical protein AB7Q97_12490 [Gammaproteobacteria bacterium]
MAEVDAGNAALERAWTRYAGALERVRAAFLASPLMRMAPEGPACAHRCLMQAQAHAHNLMIGPDPDDPVFLYGSLFDPFAGFAWLLPNPDFFYRMAFLNGSGTYRILVRRNDTDWINFHMRSDMWGMPGVEFLGSFDLERFAPGADGNHEIIASARPQGGNWLPLQADSGYNFINVRAALLDWESGVPAQFHIDVIEPPAHPTQRGAEHAARRIERAARFVEFSALDYTIAVVERTLARAGGVNRFAMEAGTATANSGNAPNNLYIAAVFELEPGQALVVDFEPPRDARYWGIQLGDICNQTLDYWGRQTSLNASQARMDADRRVRCVLAAQDPGVPNWLDTMDHRAGIVFLRAHGSAAGVSPRVTRVALEDLDRHLPAGTPVVEARARRETIARRERAIRRLYGY